MSAKSLLALPSTPFAADKLARLDAAIVRHNPPQPRLEEFVLPSGTHSAALCHVARSVARRAKRDYFHLMRSEATSPEGSRYLNRLSDQLFVPSRTLNRTAGQGEILWKRT